jgi:hypothetical protein
MRSAHYQPIMGEHSSQNESEKAIKKKRNLHAWKVYGCSIFFSIFQYMEIFSYKNMHGKPYKYSGKLTGEHTSKVLANSHDVSSALPRIHNIDAYQCVHLCYARFLSCSEV